MESLTVVARGKKVQEKYDKHRNPTATTIAIIVVGMQGDRSERKEDKE
jgi:hypothetical protein